MNDPYRSETEVCPESLPAATTQTYRTPAPTPTAESTELEKKLAELRSQEARFLREASSGANVSRVSATIALCVVQIQLVGHELVEVVRLLKSRFDSVEARLDKLEGKTP